MASRKPTASLLLVVVLSSLLLYWGWWLYRAVWHTLNEAMPDVGGLAWYILGVLVMLATLWGVAYLNYRLAFRRWLPRRSTQPYYWTWQCLLAWLLFELLQRRTEYEPGFVDENMLVTLVLTVFILVYGYIADAFHTRREQIQLMQQKTAAELALLKTQVNPHFLFNALNTIYSEAQRVENETVAQLIGQLAGIMRFSLQESTKPRTSIENELQFLEKYLALQRARLPQNDQLRLSTELDWDGQPAFIAPLLLIPFVENAFQYGISLVQPSYIDLTVRVDNGQLSMHLVNSRPANPSSKGGMGTGITNARQRLKLLYPDRHQLRISPTPDSFVVTLTLNL